LSFITAKGTVESSNRDQKPTETNNIVADADDFYWFFQNLRQRGGFLIR